MCGHISNPRAMDFYLTTVFKDQGSFASSDANLLIPEDRGLKLDTGKPRMELLDPYAMEQVARVLTFGAEKYDPHNWRKGISYGRLLGAALRHIFAFIGGEDNDKESGLPHPAHAMANLMFVLGMTQLHPELDDRA
jgi:hypothetical protein